MIVMPKKCKAESKVDRRVNIDLAADGCRSVRVGNIAVASVLVIRISKTRR